MAKTKTYGQWRLEKLADPARAARYLNAAKKDSKEAFLHALKNVIQAREVAKVAREAGVSRESVYRSFSAEGNPTYDTLSAILEAVDIDFEFTPIVHVALGPQQREPDKVVIVDPDIPNGNLPRLGFFETGAVRYLLSDDVVNAQDSGANFFVYQLNTISCSVNAEELIGKVPVHLLSSGDEHSSCENPLAFAN
jgi:probable addiction module antidote protein